jgi:hypothetical protein
MPKAPGDSFLTGTHKLTIPLQHRADDKTAEEYQLEGGATLHLVLALRGGRS